MSKVLTIPAAKGASNVTTFNVFDTNGAPVDLDALGATEVNAEICSPLHSSVIPAAFYASNTVGFQFGLFNVPAGTYHPKIFYTSPSKPDGEILLAEYFETSMVLKMVC